MPWPVSFQTSLLWQSQYEGSHTKTVHGHGAQSNLKPLTSCVTSYLVTRFWPVWPFPPHPSTPWCLQDWDQWRLDSEAPWWFYPARCVCKPQSITRRTALQPNRKRSLIRSMGMWEVSLLHPRQPDHNTLEVLLNGRGNPLLHSSTGVSPASLMMNRHIRTKIPCLDLPRPSKLVQIACFNGNLRKSKAKAYKDRRH